MEQPEDHDLEHVDERVWVFKDGDNATVQGAKGLVNQKSDIKFENLYGKRLGNSWRGQTRIVVLEMRENE